MAIVFFKKRSIKFIDKTDPSDPEKQENLWIHILKTTVLWGLNVLGNSGWSNLDCNKCSVTGFHFYH